MFSFTAISLGLPGNFHYINGDWRLGARGLEETTPQSQSPVLTLRRLIRQAVPSVGPERLSQPVGQTCSVARGHVSFDVPRAPHAGNGCAHRRMLEDEPKREFGQIHAVRDEWNESVDVFQRSLEVRSVEVGVTPVAVR